MGYAPALFKLHVCALSLFADWSLDFLVGGIQYFTRVVWSSAVAKYNIKRRYYDIISLVCFIAGKHWDGMYMITLKFCSKGIFFTTNICLCLQDLNAPQILGEAIYGLRACLCLSVENHILQCNWSAKQLTKYILKISKSNLMCSVLCSG